VRSTPLKKEIGIFVQAGSTTIPPPALSAHVLQMVSKAATDTQVLLQAIKNSGMPGLTTISLSTPVVGMTAGPTFTGNVSKVAMTVRGVPATYLSTTAAKTAFAAAFAVTVRVKPDCVFVSSVTSVDSDLAVVLSFTCNVIPGDSPFQTAEAAYDFADQITRGYLPSPGRSSAIINALHQAGLLTITSCNVPVFPGVVTDKKLYIGITVTSTSVLVVGVVALILVGMAKDSMDKVNANRSSMSFETPTTSKGKPGWRQRILAHK
jgi:hypothetical protein